MKAVDRRRKLGASVILTIDSQANAELLDIAASEKHLKANNLLRLLRLGERDIAEGKTRPIRAFLREFKRSMDIPTAVN